MNFVLYLLHRLSPIRIVVLGLGIVCATHAIVGGAMARHWIKAKILLCPLYRII